MLRFFSKIRFRLAAENRVAKYMRYAVGEILLVTIGILIALQVNTWNGEWQNRKKERVILTEIMGNLAIDSLKIDQVLEFNEKKAPEVDRLMEIFADTLTNTQRLEIFNDVAQDIVTFDIFEPVRTAYNNLLSSESIDLIKDKEIRNLVIAYYEKDYQQLQERVISTTRRIVDDYFWRFITKESVTYFSGIPNEFPSTENLNVHKDPRFFAELFTTQKIIGYQSELVSDLQEKNIELALAIKNYLGQRE